MSDKQIFFDSVEKLKEGRKQKEDALNIAVEQVEHARQEQRDLQNRQY